MFMRWRMIRKMLLATMLAAFGTMACGCDRPPRSGGEQSAVDPKLEEIVAANAVAKSFVKAMNELDAGTLAKICVPPLDEGFAAVKTSGEVMAKALAFLQQRYPDSGSSEVIRKLKTQWHQPMSVFKDLSLAGRVRQDHEKGEFVYEITFVDTHSFATRQELIIRRIGDRYLVQSYGKTFTLRSEHVGFLKSISSKYALSLDRWMKQVTEGAPPTIEAAADLWQHLLPSYDQPDPGRSK